jgi:hypothetical protein
MNTNASRRKTTMFHPTKRELNIIERSLNIRKEYYLNRACRLAYDGDELSSERCQILIKEIDLLLTKLGFDDNKAIKINLKKLKEDNDNESSN